MGKQLEGKASRTVRQRAENLITEVRCPVLVPCFFSGRKPLINLAGPCKLVMRVGHSPGAARILLELKPEGLRGVQMGENGIPDITVVMATQDDDFRKPNPGMWTFFVEHLNGGVEPSARPALLKVSCFCAGSNPHRQPVSASRQQSFAPVPELTGRVRAELSESFYVGDAAGRKHDFADSDKCAHTA